MHGGGAGLCLFCFLQCVARVLLSLSLSRGYLLCMFIDKYK
jgi:hypothetical protein